MASNSRVYTLTSSQKMMILCCPCRCTAYPTCSLSSSRVPPGSDRAVRRIFRVHPLDALHAVPSFLRGCGARSARSSSVNSCSDNSAASASWRSFLPSPSPCTLPAAWSKSPQSRPGRHRRHVGRHHPSAVRSLVDIGKVWIGVEEFEAVPGLAQSVVLVEGIGFLNDVLFSGILFALLPTLYLVPRLYGKIEPLLGIKPRQSLPNTKSPASSRPSWSWLESLWRWLPSERNPFRKRTGTSASGTADLQTGSASAQSGSASVRRHRCHCGLDVHAGQEKPRSSRRENVGEPALCLNRSFMTTRQSESQASPSSIPVRSAVLNEASLHIRRGALRRSSEETVAANPRSASCSTD